MDEYWFCKCKGSSNNSYSYYDKIPLNGKNYYRLKMNDKDGKFTYSPVRTVEFGSKVDFTIIPNPSNNKATFYFSDNVKGAEIIVIDMQGRLLKRHSVTDNTTSYTIDTDMLPTGTYLVKMQLATGLITKKLVVSY
jgi:hypothetical protein